MPLAENLAAAEAAVTYVKGLNLRASNKVGDRLLAQGGIDHVIAMIKPMNLPSAPVFLPAAHQGVDATRTATANMIDFRAKCAHYIQQGFGNCQEQAEIALLHMYDANIRPVSLFSFSTGGYDHVWAMAGVHVGFQSNNLRSCGAEAVWCDPWQSDGVAFAVSAFIKGEVRNLNAIYKCNTLELVEAGLPRQDIRWT